MKKIIHYSTIVLGIISLISFIADYFIFTELRPKMVAFEAISQNHDNLMLIVGAGLLVFLAFCVLSLLRIVQYLKKAKKITLIYSLLLAGSVLCLLFVFSDVALLQDIDKQYKLGLDQPEWSLVYPIMSLQFIAAIIFIIFHLFGFKKENQVEDVVKDSNIFLVAQYVGIICGLSGFVLSGLGFFFSSAWNLYVHTIISSIILLIPYVLIVGYWLSIKLKENISDWYDEKQIQDIGKSSFMTLIISVVFMILLFALNFNNLNGVISMIWLPLYLFFVLTLFSFGNLYFSKKD
ncbi:MAG: hypothetical protein ABIJ91_05370 [Candidatus Kuenenbacteria bacterium]